MVERLGGGVVGDAEAGGGFTHFVTLQVRIARKARCAGPCCCGARAKPMAGDMPACPRALRCFTPPVCLHQAHPPAHPPQAEKGNPKRGFVKSLNSLSALAAGGWRGRGGPRGWLRHSRLLQLAVP